MKPFNTITKHIIPEKSIESLLSKTQNTSQTDGIYDIQEFSIIKSHGTGSVHYVNLKNDIHVTQYDITLYDDFTFQLDQDQTPYIYFVYGLEGECHHSIKNADTPILVEALRTAIIQTHPETKSKITIKKNSPFRFSILRLKNFDCFKNFKTHFNLSEITVQKLEDAFSSITNGLHICSYNLKIADQLRLLQTTRDEFQITSWLYFKSHYQIILSLHLEHFYKEIYETRIETPLNKTELLKIRKITEYIIDKPMLKHTIKHLCSKAILSPVKLQEGFRCIHGTTVSNYIRNVRVEKARDLLIYTDNNVSEVSYMVGFTSRSYFCKIFKEKYGCNATAYRDKYKDTSVDLNKI